MKLGETTWAIVDGFDEIATSDSDEPLDGYGSREGALAVLDDRIKHRSTESGYWKHCRVVKVKLSEVE